MNFRSSLARTMLPRRICAKHSNAKRFRNVMCSAENYSDVRTPNVRRWRLLHERISAQQRTMREKQNFVWQNMHSHTALNLRRSERMNLNSNSNAFTANTTLCSLVCTALGGIRWAIRLPSCAAAVRRAFKSSRSALLRGLEQKKTITACLNGKQQHNFQIQIYSIHFIVIIVVWYEFPILIFH